MPTNQLAPPDMPWLTGGPPLRPNGLGPPLLNYAAPPPDASTGQGAAIADTGQAAWQWLQDQRAESVRQGLLDPNTGLPTQAGLVDAARQTAQGVMMGTTAPGEVPPPGIVAYHGSPHSFDQFDTSKIGTGEGAQAYGHGLYFAGNEGVARSYRDALSAKLSPTETTAYVDASSRRAAAQSELDALHNKMVQDSLKQGAQLDPEWGEMGVAPLPHIVEQYKPQWDEAASRLTDAHNDMQSVIAGPRPKGSMYQVNIGADPEHFLDWDKPRDALPANVQAWAKENYPGAWDKAADGSSLYNLIVKQTQSEYPGATKGYMPPPGFNAHAQVTQEMANAGIPGIRYLDQGSRGAGQGTHNYVVFDAATIEILRKYGIAGLLAGGGAAAAGTQQQQPSQ